MGLNTDNVTTGGGSLPKIMGPGNNTVKLHKLELQQWPFMEADDAYYLTMHLETKPIEGFEGFFIDKDDQSKGTYEGQVGQVKASRWYYKDSLTKSGKKIERDLSLLQAIKNICEAANCIDWFEGANNVYDTIEEFVEGFNNDKPYAGKWMDICIAGKEYEKKDSEYTGWDLFLPKYMKGYPTIVAEGDDRVMTFSEEDHRERLESEPVENFGDDDSSDSPFVDNSADDDFKL